MASNSALRIIHDTMKKGFQSACTSQSEVRLQCLEDRRFCFITGAQWENNFGRQFANRPRFEINKVHLSVIRIINEYSNNRISVTFKPKDDAANDDTAETLNGLLRADENEYNAKEAYDNAFLEGVSGGMGAWRLKHEYEDEYDEDDDRQRVCIDPIFDADSCVFFDNDAKRQDKSDAKRCWVLSSMSPDAYEEEYGEKASGASMDKTVDLQMFDWFAPEAVYIAEYYEVELIKQTVKVFTLQVTGEEIKVIDDKDHAQEIADLIAQGYVETRSKKVKKKQIHKYIVDGQNVLEDCGIIAGMYIPIIPFYGKRIFIDNIERISGHVRLSKDPQQLYNMEVSGLAELAVANPIQRPILTPEQVAGHAQSWADDDVARHPFLLINDTYDQSGQVMPRQPVAFTQPPTVPQALTGLIQISGADVAELTGSQQQGEQLVSNTSAQAVEMVQAKIDMQAYIYMDNFAKAMEQSGRVWLSMVKELYDEAGRKMRSIGTDETQETIELKQPSMEDGVPILKNDLQKGKFDVVVDVGASYTTRRDAMIGRLEKMLPYTTDPEYQSAIVGSILSNVEGEGLQDLRAFARKKLITSGVIKPNDDEAKEMQEAQANAANAPPDANTKLANSLAEEAEAKAKNLSADTSKKLADADETRVDTATKLNELQGVQLSGLIQLLQAIEASQLGAKQQIEQNDQQMQLPQGGSAVGIPSADPMQLLAQNPTQ